jgi:hypothetical protein
MKADESTPPGHPRSPVGYTERCVWEEATPYFDLRRLPYPETFCLHTHFAPGGGWTDGLRKPGTVAYRPGPGRQDWYRSGKLSAITSSRIEAPDWLQASLQQLLRPNFRMV